MLIPTLPASRDYHSNVQGVGYPGTQRLLKHESVFASYLQRQTMVEGKTNSSEGAATIIHSVPTKNGMGGTHLSEKGTPNNSFQYIHSQSIDPHGTGTNGGLTTNNIAFARQYSTHIEKDLPASAKPQAQTYLNNFSQFQKKWYAYRVNPQ